MLPKRPQSARGRGPALKDELEPLPVFVHTGRIEVTKALRMHAERRHPDTGNIPKPRNQIGAVQGWLSLGMGLVLTSGLIIFS